MQEELVIVLVLIALLGGVACGLFLGVWLERRLIEIRFDYHFLRWMERRHRALKDGK